jgi:two-component system, response regulator YesN
MMKQNHAASAFSQLLLSGTWVHEGDFSELQQEYGVYIQPNIVLVVSVDRYPDLAMTKPMQWRTEIGRSIIDKASYTMLDLGIPCLWLWPEEGVLALLMQVDVIPGALVQVSSRTLQIAQSLQQNLAAQDISVSIGIGMYYDNPHLIHQSFQEAAQSMSGRFFHGNQLVFQFSHETPLVELWHDSLTQDKTELLALVQIGDEQGVVVQITNLLGKMAGRCQHNEDLFKSEVVDLVMLMSRVVVESGVSATDVLSKNARFIHELYMTIRYDKFVRKVCDFGRWLTGQVSQFQFPNASTVIRQAIQYMKRCHRQSMSLDEVAHYCSLSKYHLSHLFKKEVGVSFIDLLNQIRVDKAVYYLKTSDLPVQQIAGLVGYQDANYFSRIFKRYLGCSPKEYRIAKLC